MPAKKRYALAKVGRPPLSERGADPNGYTRNIAIMDEPCIQATASEHEFVTNYSVNGIDPIELEYRRNRNGKTDLDRAIQLQRLLPHRSSVSPEMAQVHDRRFMLWKQGYSQTEISALEDVEDTAVARSIAYGLSLLPSDEILRVKNTHLALNTHLEHSTRFQTAITRLLESDTEYGLHQGLTHFERVTGITGGSTLNVNVDARKQTANFGAPGSHGTGPQSFEEAFEVVRRGLAESNTDASTDPTNTDEPAIEAEILTPADASTLRDTE